ncbi:homocitrate synthase/isopropylmalate synthase family protein, partial [Haladaptatus sp.]|uniref:homocitrate synthase/isopropylmalate synthase family protein n=1 Tax=Haladaptatus sp. TaxID=1973141 RepID=UPI003C638322
RITELSEMIAEYSEVETPVNKPVVGANAFAHESGIHAAGVIENSDTFETGVMKPEMIGAEREFVLGKHTGTHAVRKHLQQSGFVPTEAEVRKITRKVKDRGAAKNRVTVSDVQRFARELGVDSHEEVKA